MCVYVQIKFEMRRRHSYLVCGDVVIFGPAYGDVGPAHGGVEARLAFKNEFTRVSRMFPQDSEPIFTKIRLINVSRNNVLTQVEQELNDIQHDL